MIIKLLRDTPRLLNIFCMLLVACMASVAMVYSLLCAAGVSPWLQFSATFGETTFSNAGQLAQIALTISLVRFCRKNFCVRSEGPVWTQLSSELCKLSKTTFICAELALPDHVGHFDPGKRCSS